MNTQNKHSQGQGEQVLAPKATRILLGIDVHAEQYTVTRKVDDQLPQPAQRFSPAQFIGWVQKQQSFAREVICCYEAGPLGYGLYRKLLELGVRCLVIAPQNLDERGKGVKTDKKDSRALVVRLDRYLSGSQDSLTIVTVPTVEQERRRAEARLRQRLQKEQQRLEATGRGMLLFHGVRVRGRWWTARQWAKYAPQWPEWMVKLLTPIRELVVAAHQQQRAWTKQLKESVKGTELAVGMGELTYTLAEREVGDWGRFKNRRQVASFSGLCAGEHSSGARRQQSSITKHGNRRLRQLLIELAWRMLRYQKSYKAVRKWWHVLGNPRASAMQRKKAIVAVARQLVVDLWRMATGRIKAAELGLVMRTTATAVIVP